MTAETSSSSVDVIDVDQEEVGFNHPIDNTRSATLTTSTLTAVAAAASLEDILEFRKKNWGLRLSVSSIAQMAGFHPFASLPQLMLQLVYQSNLGKELLEYDSRLLGVSLLTEEEMLLNIATKAGKAVRESMKQALAVQKGKLVLKTNQEVKELKQRVLTEAKQQSDKLNTGELKMLEKGVVQLVYRGYGTFHEQEAIDLYEKKCGWEIRERNAVMMKWPFIRSEEVITNSTAEEFIQVAGPTAVPLTSATKSEINRNDQQRTKKRPRPCNSSGFLPAIEQSTVIDAKAKTEGKTPSGDAEVLLPEILPFFCIYGSVDGIRDELWYDEKQYRSKEEEEPISTGQDYDDGWKLRQVIIECKHRMKASSCRSSAPPLYDQIQAVVYCLMYETSEADIIEVFRSSNESHNPKTSEAITKDPKNNKNASATQHIDIVTSRVTLHDPLNRHRENWELVILPRLRMFVEAVYSIRSDDGKRYQLLSSIASMDDDASWRMIIDECPWLKDCDTAYSRSQSTQKSS